MNLRLLTLTVLTALALAPLANARTVYRCVRDNTVSLATFQEKGAKCEAKTFEDDPAKAPNLFGNMGLVQGNLYEGEIDGKAVYTTRSTPGFALVTRFTVETPKASPAHVGLGQVGKARLDKYNDEFRAAAKAQKIDEALLRAIAHAESGFDPQATSYKGAQGLMQLMPATAAELHVANPYLPRDSINGGAKMLKRLHTKYRGDLTKVIAAYNAGTGAVAKYNGVPPYRETVEYVSKVTTLLGNYRAALGMPSSTLPVIKAAQ